jgi:diacylglycerol kinase family enzyme
MTHELAPTQPHFNEQGQFSELHYFRNPASSNASIPKANPDRFRDTYDQHGLRVYEHETAIDPEEMLEKLARVLDEDVVIAVSSGDGGAGTVAAQLLEAKQKYPDLRHLNPPVLFVPTGNKNDLARTVHSKESYEYPELALLRGIARSVSPLEVSRRSEEENYTYDSLDFAYTTFGISGDTSAAVNTHEYRNQRLLRSSGGRFIAERRAAIQAYMHAEPFTVTAAPGTDQEESYQAFELMFANGPNMAGTLHPDVSLFESRARVIEVHNRLIGFTTLAALSAGRPVGELLDRENSPRIYDLNVSPDTTIRGQANGEAYKLHEGRHRLTVEISRMAVSLLTTAV